MMNPKIYDYFWQLLLADGSIVNQFSPGGIENSFKNVSPREMCVISLIPRRNDLPQLSFRLNGMTPIYFRRTICTLTVGSKSVGKVDKILYALGYESGKDRVVYLIDPETKDIFKE